MLDFLINVSGVCLYISENANSVLLKLSPLADTRFK